MISFIDVWRYTIPTQDKFIITKPQIVGNDAAFFVYYGDRRKTVEIQVLEPGVFALFVTGIEPIYTNPLNIRQDMLDAVKKAFEMN